MNLNEHLHRKGSGFTIVELAVVIAVIAILATLSSIGLSLYQNQARDAQRTSNVSSIGDALEKYYDKNGEYPSCSLITQEAQSVSNSVLDGIDKAVLLTPNAPNGITNSIQCNDLSSTSDDFFQYEGDGSTECTSGNSCLSFKLKYRNEADGGIKEIASRRNTQIDTSGNITLTGNAVPFSSIALSWNNIINTTSYTVQVSTSNTFASIAKQETVTTRSTTITGLTPGTSYYARVSPNSQTGTGSWSNTLARATTRIATPNPTTSSSNPTTVTLTWPAISGNTQYTIQRSTSNTFPADATTTQWTQTGTNKVFSDSSPSTTHYFRVMATAPDDQSPWSAIDSILPIVPAPAIPTVSAAMSGTNAIGTAGGAACSWGITQYGQRYHTENTATNGAWSAYTAFSGTATYSIAALQGSRYVFQSQARCVYLGVNSATTTSASTDDTFRAITDTPNPSASSSNPTTVTLSWPAISNATQYIIQRSTSNTFPTGATTTQWSQAGTSKVFSDSSSNTTHYFRVAASTTYAQGPWSATDSIRPVLPAPTAPTISVAMSGANAVGTASATCAYGTPQYSQRYHSENTATNGAWSAYTAFSGTTTYSVAALQGHRYVFQSQARCSYNGDDSTAVASAGTDSTFRAIVQPAAPTFTAPTSWTQGTYYTVNYTSYCPTGTTLNIGPSYAGGWRSDGFDPNDGVNYDGAWGSNDRWTFPSGYGSGSTVRYFTNYRCSTVYSTSPNSAVTTTTVTVR